MPSSPSGRRYDIFGIGSKEFFAAFDLRILDAPTRLERTAVEKRLKADPEVASRFTRYVGEVDRAKVLFGAMFKHVNREADDRSSGAALDQWQLFAERGVSLLCDGSRVGFVLPSAFHANQGATGIRDLYMNQNALRCCYSFENRRKLFEIHSSFKFAAVVCERGANADAFPCAFYLQDLEWLFSGKQPLRYTRKFVKATGGQHLTLLELRGPDDLRVAEQAYRSGQTYLELIRSLGMELGRELHMTDDAHRFTAALTVTEGDARDAEVGSSLLAKGYLPLHEGKTFHQFDDHWEVAPRYLVALQSLADKPGWIRAVQYYRLAFRDIASSTNERTGIFCLLPPGTLFGNTAPCERNPDGRPNSNALMLEGLLNAHAFDWTLRQKAATHVNLFILGGCPVPRITGDIGRFIAHNALRLSANHSGYAALWGEQLGSDWREREGRRPRFPVIEGDDTRWAVRAAIDAVVADAYALERADYEHVLASFSHKSYPAAPTRCLEAYDELKRIGLARFCRKHDPYFDVPLVEALPKPVIDLPVPAEAPVPLAGAEAPGRAKKAAADQLTLSEFQMAAEPIARSRRKRSGKKAR